MRTAIMAVLAALTVLAGAWIVASFQLTARVSETALDARTLCRAPRGNAPFTSEVIAKRFVEMAEAHDLQASDVRVVTAPVGNDPSSTTAQVAGSLAKLTHGKLKMTATEVTVSGRVQGKKWLWSVDRDVESSCVYQGRITRVAK